MGTRLPGLKEKKHLYSHWSSRITDVLESDAGEGGVVVNCASSEYWNAVDEARLEAAGIQVLRCDFREGVGASSRVIGVHAKRARGLFVRFVCQSDPSDVEDLKRFDLEGYTFDPKLSSESAPNAIK